MVLVEVTVIRVLGCPACRIVEDELQDLITPLGWVAVFRPPTWEEKELFYRFPVSYLPDKKVVLGTGVLDEIEEGIKSGAYVKAGTND